MFSNLSTEFWGYVMRTIVAGLFAFLVGATPLHAGPWPDRPISIVVPFGKGTTADLVAAVVAEAMSKNIGQNVVVELKPGAGGASRWCRRRRPRRTAIRWR
jgi:tripartite-type tricarboxylate transporter receptor subunit TctC